MTKRWQVFRPDLQSWSEGIDAEQIAALVAQGKIDLGYDVKEEGNFLNWHQVGSIPGLTQVIEALRAENTVREIDAWNHPRKIQVVSRREAKQELAERFHLQPANVGGLEEAMETATALQAGSAEPESSADHEGPPATPERTEPDADSEGDMNGPADNSADAVSQDRSEGASVDGHVAPSSVFDNQPPDELAAISEVEPDRLVVTAKTTSFGGGMAVGDVAEAIAEVHGGLYATEEWGTVTEYDPFGQGAGVIAIEGKPDLDFYRDAIHGFVSPSQMVGAFVRAQVAKRGAGYVATAVYLDSDASPERVALRELDHTVRSQLRGLEQSRGKGGHGKLLTRWATIGMDYAAAKLAEKAQKGESWGFRSGSDPYKILKNYLSFTFYRLMWENKIAFTDSHACFNTGLADDVLRPIYALFERKEKFTSRPVRFLDFVIEGEGPHRFTFTKQFPHPPKPAKYIDRLEHIFLDPDADIKLQQSHLIKDGIGRGRFPKDFLLRYEPDQLQKIRRKDRAWLREYANILQTPEGHDSLVHITSALMQATDAARKRLVWNYKTAIPSYYPEVDGISLLLPLCLVRSSVPDTALVLRHISRQASYGATVLTLDMAYSNARLIARPLSDWLSFEVEEQETDEDADE